MRGKRMTAGKSDRADVEAGRMAQILFSRGGLCYTKTYIYEIISEGIRMKVLCFGSLNIDMVYAVPHFVRGGETLAAHGLARYTGGKGLNQAVALARAGASVRMAGAIGEDGRFLLDALSAAGADTALVEVRPDTPSGHAIIQNDAAGDNCILLYGGANRTITQQQIRRTVAAFAPGDAILLQNEVNGLTGLFRAAADAGLRIFFNPSPMEAALLDLPLGLVDTFFLNEGEAAALTGLPASATEEELPSALARRFPRANIVLTLGGKGARYLAGGQCLAQPAYAVPVVDTTGAGDTFTGFFLAAVAEGQSPAAAMDLASRAAAIAVSRPGAAPSIPTRAEAEAFRGGRA